MDPNRGKRQQAPCAAGPGGKGALRRVYIVLAVIAAVIVILFAAYRFLLARRPRVDAQRPGLTTGDPDASRRKEDFYTFLVVGKDTGGGGNTDTILLAAYNVADQELNVMSIPRDTLVNIDADIKKINAVYNYAGGGEDGIAALKEEVGLLVGFVPDFHVVVEWKAVGELVDALGGVWYDVPLDMNYDDPVQDLSIHVPAGYQKLDGSQAMGVVRYRSGYSTGDIGRIETQQDFLKAVVAQCLKIENLTRINALVKVFTDNVDTNLSVGDLAWLGEKAVFGGLEMEHVSFMTMPWVSANGLWSRIYHNHPSYVAPDTDALVALVNEGFNPFLEDIDPAELDTMYVNADGTLGCTSGRLADQNYNDWVRSGGGFGGGGQTTPAAQPSQEPEPTPPPESEPPETAEPPAETGDPNGTEPPAESEPPVSEPPASEPPAEPEPAPEPEPTPDPNLPPEGIPIG